MATKSNVEKTSDKDRRKAAATKKKESKADLKAAKVRRYDAKTEARKKAGGAGVSVVFYEIAMPEGTIKVKKNTGKGKRWRTMRR